MLVKITDATQEPVSLAEIKEHLRVTTDNDDQLLRRYIQAATSYAELQIPGGRAFMTQTWDWKIHEFPGKEFYVPRPPLKSVTSISYFSENSSTSTTVLSSTSYIVHTPTSIAGSVELHPNEGDWPTIAGRMDAVTVRFVAGYTSCPEPIKHAIKLLVNHYYEQRSVAGLTQEIPHGVNQLLGSCGYGDYT